MKKHFHLALLSVAALLSACSTTVGDKIDYRSQASTLSPLEVPPTLNQLPNNATYTVKDDGVNLSSAKLAQPTTTTQEKQTVAPQSIGNVMIHANGNQRWLVTTQSPTEIWPQLESFWRSMGFSLTQDDAKLGVMETNWAENKAQIQTGFSNATLNKMLESFYSTPYRDQFVTNVDRQADGKIAIYIVHRGMYQVYTNERSNHTVWQPSKPNPTLENEMLRRVMVALGTPESVAKAAVDSAAQTAAEPSIAPVTQVNGASVITLSQDMASSWRLVGAAINRAGFSLLDRDRSSGVYVIRYTLGREEKDSSFFGRLFGKTTPQAAAKYQIVLTGKDASSTLIQVQSDRGGSPVDKDTATQILKVLSENIL